MKESRDRILQVFASNVLWFRTRMDISQEELGYQADLHRTYVGEIERAEGEPTIIAVAKLSRAFALLPFELLVERPDAMKFWEETRQKNARTGRRK